MLNTKSSVNKSILNSTFTSVGEKGLLNKTIDFKTIDSQEKNPSLYGVSKPANFSALKPTLQGRVGSPTIHGTKYQSPYAQPKKKRRAKKE
jgi:hypothetical protein